MYNEDGSVQYEGGWRDLRRHGGGAENLSDGERYEGAYRDDEFDGLGTFLNVDGEVYSGEWENGLKGGLGMLWDANSTLLLCGRWELDELVRRGEVPRSKISAGHRLSAAGRPTLPAASAQSKAHTPVQLAECASRIRL